MARRHLVSIDAMLNAKIDDIAGNIKVITGLNYSKPQVIRFLIEQHYQNKIKFKRKRNTKNDICFI